MKTIKTIGILVLMILSSTINAQPWNVNPADFQFNMNATGQVSIDGNIIDEEGAYLGAFVNDECRGVSPTTSVDGNYKLFQMTIYSNNSEGDSLVFKLMDASDQELTIANEMLFVDNAIYGNIDAPFLWMDLEQYASADFLSFELDSQVTSATINAANKTISIMVSRLTDKSSLIPVFTLAPEAIAYINQVEQVSEQTANDYTNVLHYTVKGVDGIESDWTAEVKFDDSGISKIEKSNFNIYPNPASSYIIIKSKNLQMENIKIIDITGKLMLSSSLRGMKQSPISTDYFTNARNDEIRTDISSLNKGIYFVKVGEKSRKLIIE